MYQLPVDYQLEDIDILSGGCISVPLRGLAAKGKRVIVGQLSVHDWFYIFLPALSGLSKTFEGAFSLIALMNMHEADKIPGYLKTVVTATQTNKKAMIYMMQVLKKVGVCRWSIWRFKRMILTDQLVELFALVYLFNTDGVKKKFNSIMNLCQKNNTELQTSSSKSSGQGGSAKHPPGYQKIRLVEKITVPDWLKKK